MTTQEAAVAPTEGQQIRSSVSRYTDKAWDWDAFPASRGYPELARAQMRYVGAGGSPKVGDSSSLPAQRFTCSLLHQDPQRYAAVHSHEIEEIFLIREGRMTVSWDFDGEMVDVVLGPGDALVNPAGRAHGFRNDGPSPVVAQFMVGHPKPMLPQYKSHPSDGTADPRFGAALPAPGDPRALEIARHLVRGNEAPTTWHEIAGGGCFAVQPYVMPVAQGGVVEPGHFSLQMTYLPPRTELPARAWDHDVALMIWRGQVEATVRSDRTLEVRAGPLDLVRVRAGDEVVISNQGPVTAQLATVIGSSEPSALWA
jgi:mannose-6-phosphate isomerase-like protein (cupin superfamily)